MRGKAHLARMCCSLQILLGSSVPANLDGRLEALRSIRKLGGYLAGVRTYQQNLHGDQTMLRASAAVRRSRRPIMARGRLLPLSKSGTGEDET